MKSIFKSIVLLIAVVANNSSAYAQRVDEELTFKGEPRESWIIAVSSDRIDMSRADEKKNLKTIVLSSFLKDKPEDTLVCGVSILEDGEVVSSTLHQIVLNEFERESALAAQTKLRTLKNLVENGKDRIASLEAEFNRTNYEVRAAAGLSDIDRNYEKAQALERSMQGYALAKQDLERLEP